MIRVLQDRYALPGRAEPDRDRDRDNEAELQSTQVGFAW
jgi:hypothetical protein